jgi:leucyl/phenylalanyl-tRNA--protein transferase
LDGGVPIEPLPSPWLFPVVSHRYADDLVGAGADQEPGTVLSA